MFQSLWVRRLLFAGAVLTTVFASLVSHAPPPGVAGGDKLAHIAVYAVNAVLASLAFPRPAAFGVALIGLLAMGGGLEWIQGSLPGRMASWGDVAANTLGLLAGGVFGWWRDRTQRA